MKTTTITRVYDEQGRMIREIRVEVERPEVVINPAQQWQHYPGWWQNPVISYTTTNGANPADVAEAVAFSARTRG